MYAHDCYFSTLPHSLLVRFTFGMAITTVNDVRHLTVTLSVVISAYFNIPLCTNTNICDNNIRVCAPFTKFAKIIDHKHFATYGSMIIIIP